MRLCQFFGTYALAQSTKTTTTTTTTATTATTTATTRAPTRATTTTTTTATTATTRATTTTTTTRTRTRTTDNLTTTTTTTRATTRAPTTTTTATTTTTTSSSSSRTNMHKNSKSKQFDNKTAWGNFFHRQQQHLRRRLALIERRRQVERQGDLKTTGLVWTERTGGGQLKHHKNKTKPENSGAINTEEDTHGNWRSKRWKTKLQRS